MSVYISVCEYVHMCDRVCVWELLGSEMCGHLSSKKKLDCVSQCLNPASVGFCQMRKTARFTHVTDIIQSLVSLYWKSPNLPFGFAACILDHISHLAMPLTN